MSWRKWIVRGLVIGILAALAGAAYLYQHWTNPAAVRQQVVAQLEYFFPGAVVSLDSARLRILGGIILNEVHLTRRDDSDSLDFIHVPSAVLYHDKEKLLDGTLSIRKVELDRPRFRLVRGSDGAWNLEGMVRPAQPHLTMPTLVIHQGTLLLEDKQANANLPGLEITNVNLTLINDPLPTVIIDGRAHSDMVGDLEIHGTWNRVTGELAMSLQVQGLSVTPALLQRLSGFCPQAETNGLNLECKADIKADLAICPGSSQPLGYDVRCRVNKGKLRHARLPLPLDEVSASLRCSSGQIRLESLQARSGPAKVSARGFASFPCGEGNFEGDLEIQHLQICHDLFDRLPERFKVLRDAFSPSGPATLRIACAQREGKWVPLSSGSPSTISLAPENVEIAFQRFPYPLERLSGALDMNLLNSRVTVDVTGFSGSRPVYIKGSWQGQGLQADGSIDIQARDVSLDDKLLLALRSTPFEKLARSFNAQGKGDIKALIRHVPGSPTFANEYHVFFHDAAVNWDPFPYRLTQVNGFLDIYPRHWEFHDFHGKHLDGLVSVQGRTVAGKGSDGTPDWLTINITGKNIRADDDLKNALKPLPALAKAWETFVPGGYTSFIATIQRPLGHKGPDAEAQILQELDVHCEMNGGSIQPRFFPYNLSQVSGSVHYHKNRLELAHFQARHGQARVKLDSGTVHFQAGGGFYLDLKELRAEDLLPDQEFFQALPATLKNGLTALELKDPVLLRTALKVAMDSSPGSSPDVYWDGQVWLEKARLRTGLELSQASGTLASRGRSWRPRNDGPQLLALNGNFRFDQATLLKQPFQDVVGHFQIQDHSPQVLTLGLKAPLFGGDVSGQVRLEFNANLRYEMNLTASQIDLQEFGRHNLGPNPQLRGLAVGRLYLTGQGAGIDTLDGNGRIDVPRGHLYNLPLLLDLLKFLGLRWPDRTMFDEVHALFNIHGPRIQVERLELLGNAVSLYGNGEFKIDGTDLKLDFYPSWGRVEQLVPPVLRSIPAEIGKKMLKIEMRGRVGSNPADLKFTKKPIPILLDPLWNTREQIKGTK